MSSNTWQDLPKISLERFITTNPEWDISRQSDSDFTYYYLHGTSHIHYDAVQEMASFDTFAGIDLRDNTLCIRALNRKED